MTSKNFRRFKELGGLVIFISVGCAPKLPVYTQLDKLRIIGMIADSPEVGDTGATVQITPYVSDIGGAGRTLSYSYQTCPDPGLSLGALPACNTPASTPVTFGPIGATNHTYTGAAPTLSIQIPSGFLATSKRPPVPSYFNGVAYLVIYTLASSDKTDSVTGLKRIYVSTNPQKNTNPSIASVKAADATLDFLPKVASYPANLAAFTTILGTNSSGTYQIQNKDSTFTTKTKELVMTWFYSDGTMASQRTGVSGSDQWTIPSPVPTGRASVMVVVARDQLGGEDIKQIEFQ